MVKRLDRGDQTAFGNMRAAGIKSFAFFIYGYWENADDGPDDALCDQLIRLRQFLSGGALSRHSTYEMRPRWAAPTGNADCRRWSNLHRAAAVSTSASSWNRSAARSGLFLRPAYMLRHAGDVAKLALTKPGHRLVLSRTVFGASGRHAAGTRLPGDDT